LIILASCCRSTPPFPRAVVKVGKSLYLRVRELCQRYGNLWARISNSFYCASF
jgi:hypothetical protein